MKGKTLLTLVIVLSMMLAVLPIFPVKAQQTIVEVRFENGADEIDKFPCDYFTAEIWVTLPSGRGTSFIDVELHWDPNLLELATGDVNVDLTLGPWFGAYGTPLFTAQPESPAGVLPDIACAFLAGGPAMSIGVAELLFTVDFHCKGPGDVVIIIWDPNVETYILDEIGTGVIIIDQTIDGTVHQLPGVAKPPDAEFTLPTSVEVCTNVTLDGSGSIDGEDTMPYDHTCPIVEWRWDIDIDDDGSIEQTLYGEVTEFHCDGPGIVGVTLTVYAPDIEPPSAPTYNEYDSEKHLVMQTVPVVGPNIDVYTDRGGKGPLGPYPVGWSDAYGPQEEVCVYANVTYNLEPVEYKPVAFEVIDPTGVSRDYRVAFTGPGGIASVCFRIPWEGSGAEGMFGDWSIVGTVDIAGTVVTDTVKFRFGYILSIRGVTVTGSPLHKLETMTIDVDIKSISMVSQSAYLTIVAYDECGVPIGLATSNIVVDPEDGMQLGYTITIPSWAFVGNGILYVNLFTAQPSLGGVPYCPEFSTGFIILKTA